MKSSIRKPVIGYAVLLSVLIISLGACKNREPVKTIESGSPSSDRTQWYEDAKYGMFIHWGPYSEAGGVK